MSSVEKKNEEGKPQRHRDTEGKEEEEEIVGRNEKQRRP